MSLNDILIELKDLVDNYENIIDKGKIAVNTRDIESIMEFIKSARILANRSSQVLNSALEALVANKESSDRVVKYISVYYRVLVYVSLPYTLQIANNAVEILNRGEYTRELSEAREVIQIYADLLDTLKSKQVHP